MRIKKKDDYISKYKELIYEELYKLIQNKDIPKIITTDLIIDNILGPEKELEEATLLKIKEADRNIEGSTIKEILENLLKAADKAAAEEAEAAAEEAEAAAEEAAADEAKKELQELIDGVKQYVSEIRDTPDNNPDISLYNVAALEIDKISDEARSSPNPLFKEDSIDEDDKDLIDRLSTSDDKYNELFSENLGLSKKEIEETE